MTRRRAPSSAGASASRPGSAPTAASPGPRARPTSARPIQVILRTEPGERLRLRGFGGGLDGLLFEPNTTATRHQIAERIRRAVADGSRG